MMSPGAFLLDVNRLFIGRRPERKRPREEVFLRSTHKNCLYSVTLITQERHDVRRASLGFDKKKEAHCSY